MSVSNLPFLSKFFNLNFLHCNLGISLQTTDIRTRLCQKQIHDSTILVQQGPTVKGDFSSFIFFSIWLFFHEHSRITGLQGKGEGIPLTPQYHFHPLYRHLYISQAITAESSPLHIPSSRTRTGNLWFPSASR